VGEEMSVGRVSVGKPEGRNFWYDLDMDGRIILMWINSIKITES
jgi:hypothetical protein